MKASELQKKLKKVLGELLVSVTTQDTHLVVLIKPAALLQTAKELKKSTFDYFSFVTAIDHRNKLTLVHRLYSQTEKQAIKIKCDISRKNPAVSSVTSVWGGAGWHEREASDLFGIRFEGHPDPRPLVLPEGWSGHPLLKDYEDEEMIPRPEFY